MRKYIFGGIAVFALLMVLLSAPAAAQGPTITPYPGAVATATAAPQRIQQAQQTQAQADNLARQAAALSQQARAEMDAARQDQAAAQSALAAQQMSAASEAIGRADARISNGLALIDQANAINTQQRDMITALNGQVISLTIESQQARAEVQQAKADKQTTLNAYNAVVAQQETNQRQNTVILIFGGVVFLALMFAVFAIVARKWSNHAAPTDPPAAPPIDSEWQDVTNDTQP